MLWHRTAQVFSGFLILITLVVSGIALLMLMQGTKFLSVQTGSMVPYIHKGDLVIDTRVPARQLAVGDVVTFMNPARAGQTITHRLVAVPTGSNQHFVTKGDANPVADPPISGSNIVGKVSWHVPYAGFGIDFARTPFGLILLVYVPALVVVGAEVKRLARYYKESEPYVAAGYEPHASERTTNPRLRKVTKAGSLSVVILLVSSGLAAPAHALLSSTATLTGNSFSTTVAPSGHLLIQQVVLADDSNEECPEADSIVDDLPARSSSRPFKKIIEDSRCCETTTDNSTIGELSSNPQIAASGNATVNRGDLGGALVSDSGSWDGSNKHAFKTNHKGRKSHDIFKQMVVIYNPTQTAVNIAHWRLVDNAGSRVISSDRHTVAPHSSFSFNWPVTNGLSRAGDHLILKNKVGGVIDTLSWGSDVSQFNPSIATTTATATLTRKAPALDTDTATDWQTSL